MRARPTPLSPIGSVPRFTVSNYLKYIIYYFYKFVNPSQRNMPVLKPVILYLCGTHAVKTEESEQRVQGVADTRLMRAKNIGENKNGRR